MVIPKKEIKAFFRKRDAKLAKGSLVEPLILPPEKLESIESQKERWFEKHPERREP